MRLRVAAADPIESGLIQLQAEEQRFLIGEKDLKAGTISTVLKQLGIDKKAL